MLERLRFPIMMTGPYSYDVAPAELFFAAFKNADINPRKVPLGKSHFDDVLKLVVKRCLEIPKQHLILNWHYQLLFVYRYLSFHRGKDSSPFMISSGNQPGQFELQKHSTRKKSQWIQFSPALERPHVPRHDDFLGVSTKVLGMGARSNIFRRGFQQLNSFEVF